MNSKTKMFWLAALAGLFVIGSLMRSPESQAKGAFSSPVTVVNTTAGPGSVLDADTATRIPYQSFLTKTNCGSGGSLDLCQFFFTAAPSGYRLVVENVSVGFNLESGSNLPVVTLFNQTGGNWTFTATQSTTPIINSGSNQNVHAYFDPADGQPYLLAISNTFTNGATQYATLSGYLENCAVVGCPAIQH